MHGNRDFMIGDAFAAEAGVTLLKDPHAVELHGTKLLLGHGDGFPGSRHVGLTGKRGQTTVSVRRNSQKIVVCPLFSPVRGRSGNRPSYRDVLALVGQRAPSG